MRLIATGSSSGVDLSSVPFLVTSLEVPDTNARRYLTEIRLSNLHATHAVQVQEIIDSVAFNNPPMVNGQESHLIEVETTVPYNVATALIKVLDLSGLSTDVAVRWAVSEVDAEASFTVENQFNGSRQVTFEFQDGGGHPVSFVAYTVVNTGAGVAGADGTSTIGLNPGTYTIRPSATNGVLFVERVIEVTTNGQTFTIQGMSESLPPSPNPDYAVGWLDVFDAMNALKSGVQFQFRVSQVLSDPDGVSLPPNEEYVTVESNSQGRLIVNFRPLCEYEGRRGVGEAPTSPWVKFVATASGTTFRLPTI